MKRISLLLGLLVAFNQAFAQETVADRPRKLKQLYLSMGIGGSFTNGNHMNSSGGNSALHITAALPKNNLLRAGIIGVAFPDTQPASEKWKKDNHRLNMVPMHHLGTYFLAVGKQYSIEKLLQFQILAGPGYTIFEEPINVHQETLDLVVAAYPVLDCDFKVHKKPGILFQAEAMVLPTRFAGITVGSYYHFVPKISNGGLTVSLNLGLLKRN